MVASAESLKTVHAVYCHSLDALRLIAKLIYGKSGIIWVQYGYDSELDMAWLHPWISLNWIGRAKYGPMSNLGTYDE